MYTRYDKISDRHGYTVYCTFVIRSYRTVRRSVRPSHYYKLTKPSMSDRCYVRPCFFIMVIQIRDICLTDGSWPHLRQFMTLWFIFWNGTTWTRFNQWFIEWTVQYHAILSIRQYWQYLMHRKFQTTTDVRLFLDLDSRLFRLVTDEDRLTNISVISCFNLYVLLMNTDVMISTNIIFWWKGMKW